MPAIPLGVGAYKRASGFLPEVRMVNCYIEKDESGVSPDGTVRVQRPGLVALDTFPVGPIRALHYRTSTSERLTIANQTLYSGLTSKGPILGTGMAAAFSTPFVTGIVSTGNAYLYDTAITALDFPDDAPNGYVQDGDQLNAYGLFLMADGRFYWLVPGETTIDPLNFATAESLPDRGIALRRLGDEFWIFGSENVEVWQPTGDQDAPFTRAQGRNFERGCLYRDSVRRFDNTLVWVGDDYQVYRASNVPEVISDTGMSNRIRQATGDCSAWTFGIDGHSFYVLRIPGQGTFAYDASTREWSNFASLGSDLWDVWTGYQIDGEIIAGSATTGNLYTVDGDAATDAGVMFERIVTGTVPLNGKPPRNDSLSVGVGCSADTTIRVRWKDGQEDYPDYYDEIEVFGPFDVGVMWRLGQPQQPYRTFEISCVAPERISLFGAVANEGWQ